MLRLTMLINLLVTKIVIEQIEFTTRVADAGENPMSVAEPSKNYADEVNKEEYLKILEQEMAEAAESLDYERAALLRDQLFELKAVGPK